MRKSLDILTFQRTGRFLNSPVPHTFSQILTKRVLAAFTENIPHFISFAKSFERRDLKYLCSSFRNIELEAGTNLVKRDSIDRALFFVLKGELLSLNPRYMFENDQKYLTEGAILGFQEFYFGNPGELEDGGRGVGNNIKLQVFPK